MVRKDVSTKGTTKNYFFAQKRLFVHKINPGYIPLFPLVWQSWCLRYIFKKNLLAGCCWSLEIWMENIEITMNLTSRDQLVKRQGFIKSIWFICNGRKCMNGNTSIVASRHNIKIICSTYVSLQSFHVLNIHYPCILSLSLLPDMLCL